jgi:phenylacetate-CoA ligase
MSKTDKIYARLPVWAQHMAVTAFGARWWWFRFGPGFQEAAAGFREREKWDRPRLEAWQADQLKSFLAAAASVPYYRDNWSASQKRAAEEGRLEELPLLDKAPLRASPRAFINPALGVRRPQTFHTSGSTGTPIATFWSAREARAKMALREVRSAGWAGVSFREPRATFSGRLVEPDPDSRGPFYRFNLCERQVYLSPFHLKPDTAGQYVEALNKHKIRWLTGYAVSYYLLAKFMLDRHIAPPPTLRAVITTSEKLTDDMRGVMEKAYGCPVFEEYGTVENALFASACEHRRLHVSTDWGVVEILRPDGTPCAPGEPGEVVATSFMRRLHPLVRYRIGDVACWDAEPCPCGRPFPVIKEVVGRIEDVVVGPDGRQMVRFHGIFIAQPHVQEGQIIQETLHDIRARIVPTPGFGPDDVKDIQDRIRQRLGPAVNVTVETVESIPRTKAGKFKAVISLLK